MRPVLLTDSAHDIIVRALDEHREKCLKELESESAQISPEYRLIWEDERDRTIAIMMNLGVT